MLIVATFPSTHATLKAEQGLKGKVLSIELIPVPRQIHSDCGFCLLLELRDAGTESFEQNTLKIKASGADQLWRVIHVDEPESSRKGKHYERIP